MKNTTKVIMSQSQGSSSSNNDSSDIDNNDSGCCSSSNRSVASGEAELKLYRAFIFSVPIFFTLILLFLFYVFYLRPRRVDWSSIRMRSVSLLQHNHRHNNLISTSDSGLKKELREMLPIIVYNESFFVKDTQCSVCLLDYQSNDRLQQIPACGHTFHMNCIDLWLASHSTCPLCRLSLLPTAKSSTETSDMQATSNEEMEMQQSNEETLAMEFSDSRSTAQQETTIIQNVSEEVAVSVQHIEVEGGNVRNNQ